MQFSDVIITNHTSFSPQTKAQLDFSWTNLVKAKSTQQHRVPKITTKQQNHKLIHRKKY